MSIAAISSIIPPSVVQPLQLDQAASSGPQFQNILNSTIQQVEASRMSANNAVQGFLAGDNQELHSTILANQNAELQFDLFIQVRNKVVSAYEEVMRMQV